MGSGNGDDIMAPSKSEDLAGNKVKFLCSYGGKILPRPVDGLLRYVGGETRVVAVNRSISFQELMIKLVKLFDASVIFKYQLPTEDLDALISVTCDEDLQNMMEEYDRYEGYKDGFPRLRAFLFPVKPLAVDSVAENLSLEQRYVDAVNGIRKIIKLHIQSPASASPKAESPPLQQPDYLFGLESNGTSEIDCLSPTAPSDLPAPSPSKGLIDLYYSQALREIDGNKRRTVRNGAASKTVIHYVQDDGKMGVMHGDEEEDLSGIRKVTSEGRMATTHFSEGSESSPTKVMVDCHGHMTADMHRVHSSPNLQQHHQCRVIGPPGGQFCRVIKTLARGGTPPVGNCNNNNSNNNSSRFMNRPEGLPAAMIGPVYLSRAGSPLRYSAQRADIVNPQHKFVYVDQSYPDKVMKVVSPHAPGSVSLSIPSSPSSGYF